MSVPQIKRRPNQYYSKVKKKIKEPTSGGRGNEFNWGALSIVLHELLIICFSHTHPDKGTVRESPQIQKFIRRQCCNAAFGCQLRHFDKGNTNKIINQNGKQKKKAQEFVTSLIGNKK